MIAPAELPQSGVRGNFHQLAVSGIQRVAEDAVAVTFEVPPGLREVFQFRAGQHLTLRFDLGHGDQRRSYSICTPAPHGPLRIGVRRLAGGLVSTHIHDHLRVGDLVDVMPPAGSFTLAKGPSLGRLVALAAGSGITPVLSLVATALRSDPEAEFTVVYSNRSVGSAMFLDELADLKDCWPARVQLVHLFSREPQTVASRNGRLDPARLRGLIEELGSPQSVSTWYLCGPLGMVANAQQVLGETGIPLERVKRELFFVEDEPPVRSAAEAMELARPGEVTVRARLNGRETTFVTRRDLALVDGLAAVREDAPFSCKGGVCATCRARLVEGRVAMDHTYALDASDRDHGFVLTCQAHPLTDVIVLDYDA